VAHNVTRVVVLPREMLLPSCEAHRARPSDVGANLRIGLRDRAVRTRRGGGIRRAALRELLRDHQRRCAAPK
jgi:hypothetical protein